MVWTVLLRCWVAKRPRKALELSAAMDPLAPNKLWTNPKTGRVFRVIEVARMRVSYADVTGHVRSTWVDSFQRRFTPMERTTLPEVLTLIRAAIRAGDNLTLRPDQLRLLVPARRAIDTQSMATTNGNSP